MVLYADRFVGGADGRYRYVNEYDLRPSNEPDHSQFIMQGIHTTLVHHYNDTLNFLIISSDNKTSTVHVSHDNYLDARPNYTINIIGLLHF